MTGKILYREVVVRLAEIHGGLELNHVDDHNAFAVTVGELCASHEELRAGLAVVELALRNEILDKEGPHPNESREDRWLRLGYRVEWSEREPRMYEVRCIGSLPADNTCLARLPTVQDVDAWIAERVKGER